MYIFFIRRVNVPQWAFKLNSAPATAEM